MNSVQFINELRSYNGSNVFNPYRDICEKNDYCDAHTIRIKNLLTSLDSAISSGVDSIWIGRDLGHKGGRRTGLALTDEAHLVDAESKWGIRLEKATKSDVVSERTAANIWKVLKLIDSRVFMWNVFPFHPHESDQPFSNRNHTAKERDYGINILNSLVGILQPKKIIAIGNDAYNVTSKFFLNLDIEKVRHPSYGGEKLFLSQIKKIYGLDKS